MTRTIKALQQLKAEDAREGTVKAIISTFNIPDRDGDVVVASAFTDGQPIKLCAWGHNWGDLPVGKGVIRVTPEHAVFEGEFFLDTTHGSDTYRTVKNLGDLQEWSWGFSIPKGGAYWGDLDGKRVRYITRTEAHEVSPVLVGANPQTSTLDIKSATAGEDEDDTAQGELEDDATPPELVEKSEPVTKEPSDAAAMLIEGLRAMVANVAIREDSTSGSLSTLLCAWRDLEWFCWDEQYRAAEAAMGGGMMSDEERDEKVAHLRDNLRKHLDRLAELGVDVNDLELTDVKYVDHGDRLRADLVAYVTRTKSLVDLRVKEGRVLSNANRERLKTLAAALRTGADDLDALLAETEPQKQQDLDETTADDTGTADAERKRRLTALTQRLAVAERLARV